jgi:predicted component of type VI protein secretion system
VKRYLRVLFVLSIFLIGSCAPKPPPPVPVEPKPTFTEKFISVHLKADSQLNLYSGSSHALHLCVYQLSDPNAFNQLSENEMGIGKLLGCDRLDAGPPVQGVAISKKLIVQPGEDQTFDLDRAEGARYVGIVAGYYQMQKRQVVRLYAIPVTEEQQQGMIVIKQKPLKINLFLGPQALQD